MSLSRLLESYRAGQEVRFSVPLGPNEEEVWVFETFASSGDWEKWENDLLESAQKHIKPDGDPHKIETMKAGKVYPKSPECFRHAFLCFKTCKSVAVVKDGEETPSKLYTLPEWMTLANDTLLAKQAFDAINQGTATTQRNLLQHVYDESKKKQSETEADGLS